MTDQEKQGQTTFLTANDVDVFSSNVLENVVCPQLGGYAI